MVPDEPDRRTVTRNELFSLLGNETRMDALRALWRALDVPTYMKDGQKPVPFTELRTRCGAADSGNFNYHLRQLEGTLLERTDDGYALSPLGFHVLQALETQATGTEIELGPATLDDPCPFCGGELVASYEREILAVECRDCPGLGGGDINLVRCPPVPGRELEELLEIGVSRLLTQLSTVARGRCPACDGPMSSTTTHCSEHVPGGDCPACSVRFATRTESTCDACGAGGVGPLSEQAFVEPATVAFFERHGLGPHSASPWRYRLAFLSGLTETVRSTDPLTAAFAFEPEAAGGTARHEVVLRAADDGIDVVGRGE